MSTITRLKRIEHEEDGGITIVRSLHPKLIGPEIVGEWGEELFALVEKEGRKKLILDFGNVSFMESRALNQLIILDKKVKAHGGALRFCKTIPEIKDVFIITRLHKLFDIRDSLQDAIGSF